MLRWSMERTLSGFVCWSHATVYTHVRREHEWKKKDLAPLGGSSPRARGTLIPAFQNMINERFIPACAGNTLE